MRPARRPSFSGGMKINATAWPRNRAKRPEDSTM
jgi:hypothetical protein